MRDVAALRHLALTSGAADRPVQRPEYCCADELPKCLRGDEAGLSHRVAGLLSPSMIDASVVHRSRSSLRAARLRSQRGARARDHLNTRHAKRHAILKSTPMPNRDLLWLY